MTEASVPTAFVLPEHLEKHSLHFCLFLSAYTACCRLSSIPKSVKNICQLASCASPGTFSLPDDLAGAAAAEGRGEPASLSEDRGDSEVKQEEGQRRRRRRQQEQRPIQETRGNAPMPLRNLQQLATVCRDIQFWWHTRTDIEAMRVGMYADVGGSPVSLSSHSPSPPGSGGASASAEFLRSSQPLCPEQLEVVDPFSKEVVQYPDGRTLCVKMPRDKYTQVQLDKMRRGFRVALFHRVRLHLKKRGEPLPPLRPVHENPHQQQKEQEGGGDQTGSTGDAEKPEGETQQKELPKKEIPRFMDLSEITSVPDLPLAPLPAPDVLPDPSASLSGDAGGDADPAPFGLNVDRGDSPRGQFLSQRDDASSSSSSGPRRKGIDATTVLEHLRGAPWYRDQIAHVYKIPSRKPQLRDLSCLKLSRPVTQALRKRYGDGHRFFSHQAEALDAVAAGKHAVVCTSTSSGKSLVYSVLLLNMIVEEMESRQRSSACALLLFPTKALAQDQLRAFKELCACLPEEYQDRVRPAVFDGDSSHVERGWVRSNANVILTNPDMLHFSFLPKHSAFKRVLQNLRLVVLDEAHVYRGSFGAHTANVLRRLRVLCRTKYGGDDQTPRFVCCTATVRNPLEHFLQLVGSREERVAPESRIAVITQDGSPAGAKTFVIWNPPLVVPPGAFRSGKKDEYKKEEEGGGVAVKAEEEIEVSGERLQPRSTKRTERRGNSAEERRKQNPSDSVSLNPCLSHVVKTEDEAPPLIDLLSSDDETQFPPVDSQIPPSSCSRDQSDSSKEKERDTADVPPHAEDDEESVTELPPPPNQTAAEQRRRSARLLRLKQSSVAHTLKLSKTGRRTGSVVVDSTRVQQLEVDSPTEARSSTQQQDARPVPTDLLSSRQETKEERDGLRRLAEVYLKERMEAGGTKRRPPRIYMYPLVKVEVEICLTARPPKKRAALWLLSRLEEYETSGALAGMPGPDLLGIASFSAPAESEGEVVFTGEVSASGKGPSAEKEVLDVDALVFDEFVAAACREESEEGEGIVVKEEEGFEGARRDSHDTGRERGEGGTRNGIGQLSGETAGGKERNTAGEPERSTEREDSTQATGAAANTKVKREEPSGKEAIKKRHKESLSKRSEGGDRTSPIVECAVLLSELALQGVRTLAFCRWRSLVELVLVHCRQVLKQWKAEDLLSKILSYRGGYSAEERRRIEKKIFKGDALAVTCTNALELGIDIGTLDSVMLLGFPGSVASMLQQFGRAGRSEREALCFLIAQRSPVDQYLVTHADELFSKEPESASLDPFNPHVLKLHLLCAARECGSFSFDDALRLFCGDASEVTDLTALLSSLEAGGALKRVEGRSERRQVPGKTKAKGAKGADDPPNVPKAKKRQRGSTRNVSEDPQRQAPQPSGGSSSSSSSLPLMEFEVLPDGSRRLVLPVPPRAAAGSSTQSGVIDIDSGNFDEEAEEIGEEVEPSPTLWTPVRREVGPITPETRWCMGVIVNGHVPLGPASSGSSPASHSPSTSHREDPKLSPEGEAPSSSSASSSSCFEAAGQGNGFLPAEDLKKSSRASSWLSGVQHFGTEGSTEGQQRSHKEGLQQKTFASSFGLMQDPSRQGVGASSALSTNPHELVAMRNVAEARVRIIRETGGGNRGDFGSASSSSGVLFGPPEDLRLVVGRERTDRWNNHLHRGRGAFGGTARGSRSGGGGEGESNADERAAREGGGFLPRRGVGGELGVRSEDVIDEVEYHQSFYSCHPGAVYLNRGKEYLITCLDLENLTATARPARVPYFTRTRDHTDVDVVCRQKGDPESVQNGFFHTSFGRVQVCVRVWGFRKFSKETNHPVEETTGLALPPIAFQTEGFWFDLNDFTRAALEERGLDVKGSLHAAAHAVVAALPLFVLGERSDI
eukprot:Cvel_29676.t1-p1 / transcript=Cvel_29676.t1 / gene=Cvel_29676 / organism=Chromera_velia_CCMP2878 / gene_product=Putative ATP-dependent helicase HRQ1, putative / transcript_product=Putative ATP-dependent helicase HRQ1, putative / location=Cvel_scaffold4104:271-10927(+) / protein_length=1891 / sequence_SO=supercontig / SO=protein_coding / is_pseudo=false